MIAAFDPRLLFSARRCDGSVAPCFSYCAGCAYIRIQCQLAQFSAIFLEKGYSSKKRILFSFFAPLRLRVNHLQPHGAGRDLIDLTRRREEEKIKNVLVRL